MRFRGALFSAAFLLAATACSHPPRPSDSPSAALRTDPLRRLQSSPAIDGARLVPLDVPEGVTFGTEPGGGTRTIAGGVRLVSLVGGAIVSAEDRLPGDKWDARNVVELPGRLGGGFLFKIEDKGIWRADRWLGPARPIYTAGWVVSRIVPGLDRVYVLAGGWRAIDGVTGEPKPLGPWPTSPTIGAYVAADGWRALAIADLRGAIATDDAGATWRTVTLPIEARDVGLRGDVLEVRGAEAGRSDAATYEVRADGQVVRLPPETARTPGPLVEVGGAEAGGSLGGHALAAAVEDGWPLEDGSAIVARDGALSRVRLDNGAVVETVAGAFPLRPSRCHPIALGAPGEIGFVCGEPRGVTALYAFDPAAGRMTELRRFDAPRAVFAAGSGGIAVRGPCDAAGTDGADPEARHYCIRARDGSWREIRVEGAVGGERVVVLGDGRFVVVSPPRGNLDGARLTVVGGERATSVPITFDALSQDVHRILDVGVWLDGIEERRPGVLGGWIEAAGTMLGYELTLDGKTTLGELVRGDVALPMVSGRFGLGWSGAHTGFETTNGGMTWASIVVPEPIKGRPIASRACGPVGCEAAGWLRVGWGTPAPSPPPSPHGSPPSAARTHLSLPLDCEGAEVSGRAVAGAIDPLGLPPPAATATDARLLTYDTSDTLDHAPRLTTLGRIYAWGPKSGEWDRGARWTVRWDWPFGGRTDVHASALGPAPPFVLMAARSGGMPGFGSILTWSIALGDDATHALLITRRSAAGEATVLELEADRTPVEIKRADGEPFGEIDAAARVGGRWYVATAPPPPPARQLGARTESIVWQVDGPVARELARIPRTPSPGGTVGAARLAWQTGGRSLGFVVDGQPLADRSGPTRWVASIDLDTGALGAIESLGAFDLGDRSAVTLCAADDSGWSTDVAIPFPITLAPLGGLHSAFGRVRLGPARACLERVTGSLGGPVSSPSAVGQASAPAGTTPGLGSHAGAPFTSINVSVSEGKSRRVFRCGVR